MGGFFFLDIQLFEILKWKYIKNKMFGNLNHFDISMDFREISIWEKEVQLHVFIVSTFSKKIHCLKVIGIQKTENTSFHIYVKHM